MDFRFLKNSHLRCPAWGWDVWDWLAPVFYDIDVMIAGHTHSLWFETISDDVHAGIRQPRVELHFPLRFRLLRFANLLDTYPKNISLVVSTPCRSRHLLARRQPRLSSNTLSVAMSSRATHILPILLITNTHLEGFYEVQVGLDTEELSQPTLDESDIRTRKTAAGHHSSESVRCGEWHTSYVDA